MPEAANFEHDIIVVGAGIAGLSAAYRLRERDVLVLEREAVVGGRTLSRQLGGYAYNVGAQVILGDRSPVAQLADELGVSRTFINKTKVPLFFRGKLYSADSQAGLLLRLPLTLLEKIEFACSALKIRLRYASLATQPFNSRDVRLKQLTSGTLTEFLGGLSPGLAQVWEAISTIADGEPPHVSTPFHPVMVMLHFLAAEYAVVGGTNQLTLALAQALAGRVLTGAAATSIRQLPGGVEVRAVVNGTEQIFSARKCVVAVPAPLANDLLEGIVGQKREVLSQTQYTAQTSAAFLLDVPTERYFGKGVWRVPVSGQRVCAVTDPSYFYPDDVKQRTGQGLLRIYTGHEVSETLAGMPRDAAIRVLRDELDTMFPGIDEHVIECDIHHWPLANTRWGVGHPELIERLQQCAGDLHFCGDYTSAGYMNGSVLSGYRVADELIALATAL
jgi:oxygen-dependent protoporphyrinogen oxidase